ncbi:hypothetical protein D3C81_1731480 [compost metagenome]
MSLSQAFSESETTTVATALLARLVRARASDMKRSTPISSAKPASGMSWMTVRVEARATKPLPVTPAAPLEDNSMMASMVMVCPRVRSILHAWAMKMAASDR